MKKIFVSIAAAGGLVAGAFAASSVVDSPAHAQTAVTAAVESDDAEADGRPDFARPHDVMDEVLGALVADRTLTQSQADAVEAAFETKHEEVRAEMEAWREEHPGRFERGFKRGLEMGGLLEDGVIDAGELSELPDDHPLKIEYLRYEPDSEVTGPLRESMHVAYTVDDLDAALAGENVILGPFVPMEGLTVAFIQQEDAVFEFMQFDA